MGLHIVPKWCRYGFILMCVTSPFWIVSLMMIFDEFDDEKDVKANERTSKVMRELKRKERIERKNERVNQRIKKEEETKSRFSEEVKQSVNDSLSLFRMKEEKMKRKFGDIGKKTYKED